MSPIPAGTTTTSRRRFLQGLSILAVGGRTLLRSGDVRAAVDAGRAVAAADVTWPEMAHRPLGL